MFNQYMKSNARLMISALLFLVVFSKITDAQQITILQQGTPTSIRGLSVVDDSVAWISGSKGYIAMTKNGGKNWTWQQVTGFEKADFRDIEAFSDKEAIIMSSGTPALVLKTTNGGANWQVKYKNTDTTYFFDAMDFANPNHGLILGDPINNKFVLMETVDGGESWKIFPVLPNAYPGEAAFAASGTCLRFDKNAVAFVTGGTHSRVITLLTDAYPPRWDDFQTTILKHGKSSQGAFSLAEPFSSVIVGGDYQNDHSTDSVAQYVYYNGKEFAPENGTFLSKKPPSGYQSCVELILGDTYLSTGTPGSNLTNDGGKTWKQIDSVSYNVCRKAKKGKLILLAGNGGKIAIFRQ
jgi:photosystem II stability/assembly factor-like uncharacterized protein